MKSAKSITGDMKLINAHCRKVWSRAKNFHTSLEYEDLVQEACIAYFKASRAFKEKKGAKFSTYASVAILNRLNYVVDCAIHYDKALTSIDDSPEFEANNKAIDKAIDLEKVLKKAEPMVSAILRKALESGDCVMKNTDASKLSSNGRKSKCVEEACQLFVESGFCEKQVSLAREKALRIRVN